MLIDGRNFWKLHGRWLVATLLGTAAAIAATIMASASTGRWPGGGSWTGLTFGLIAALIFVFEIALVAKKTRPFRTARWLLSAQAWMKAHIWLGLFTVPLVALHSGGRIGGTLTTVFVLVFVAVIASGVWGLFLQNLLPRMLLEVAPAETIYSQINQVGQQYAAEARRLVLLACGSDDFAGDIGKQEVTTSLSRQRVAAAAAAEHIRGASRNVGLQIQRSPHPASDLPRTTPSPPIQRALAVEIQPFLMTGTSTSKLLGSRARNAWFFEDLRLRVAPELRTLVGQLEELCERRRQLNVQRIMHFWLHNWLWVHLPLSIALLALLLAHVVLAFRFG